jgi:spermidine synthase
VLGGGDGLAVREILKYPQIESITLVDLDPEMTRLFSTHPMLTALNQRRFSSPKVHIINADAFPWVDSNTDSFDFIVIDFPDPTNYSLGKLYTTAFYKAAARHLSAQGLMVVQSTSPDVCARFVLVHCRDAEAGGTAKRIRTTCMSHPLGSGDS